MPAGLLDVSAFVEAFEEAHARDGHADLARFLPPAGHPLRLGVLLELVCIDLEHGWVAGRPTPVGDYRRRFPELFEAPEAVRDVLFEDYRLRVQAEEGSLDPGVRSQVLADPSALTPDPLAWPPVGSAFEGSRLVHERGGGAFARVFLAEQGGLAGRPVVLKVARQRTAEPRTLARLQHTHVVPVYSAHAAP